MKHLKTVPLNWKHAALAGLIALGPQAAAAQENIFAPGWTMDTETSSLRFQSVKNETRVESSTFASYAGTIDENGLATVRIAMDSVDTNVDLRNVRMRFLLFETFQFPEAVITMQLDQEQLASLRDVRRQVMVAPYTIELHGITSEREAEIAVMLLDDDTVVVTSGTPISLPITDFGMDDGVAKLEEAAKVDILPSATVTFDFTFNRSQSPDNFEITSAELVFAAGLEDAALEDDGDFSLEACVGRFEILSRTDNITFATSSAVLDDSSNALLDSIVDIIDRCPELTIRVDGHTDSDGSASLNQALSENRAGSVRDYLVAAGADSARVDAIGFGETAPVVENTSAENKLRNRRIEFSVVEG